MYNLILYIGVGLIVGGFLLFLYSEMRLRQLEIEESENQKFIDAILRTQQLQNIRRDIRKWTTLKSNEGWLNLTQFWKLDQKTKQHGKS